MKYTMVWVGWDLKDHLVLTPLPWTGTPSTRWHCSKPHPTCLGHFQGCDREQKHYNRLEDKLLKENYKNLLLLNLLQYGAS